MLSYGMILLIVLVAVLWYHEALWVKPTVLQNLKSFYYIYKEHRSKYANCDQVYRDLDNLLEKNAKAIQSHVVTGRISILASPGPRPTPNASH